MQISAIVLTCNEEKNINGCLETLSWCDEIIVLDDFSNKNPVFSQKLNAKVYKRKLDSDFSSQRNFGLGKAKNEWLLFIDADERVSQKLAQEIQKTIQGKEIKEQKINGFFLKRKVKFLGKWLKFGETGSASFLRLGRKGTGKWQGKVHEVWQIKGKKGKLKEPLIHKQDISLKKFIKRLDFYSTLRAKELFKKGKRFSFFEFLFFPLLKFMQNFFLKRGFLDGIPGLILAFLMSFHSFLVRAKLFILEKNDK